MYRNGASLSAWVMFNSSSNLTTGYAPNDGFALSFNYTFNSAINTVTVNFVDATNASFDFSDTLTINANNTVTSTIAGTMTLV